MFWVFGPEACGILAPQPGNEPAPSAAEGEVLTTGLSGKSEQLLIFYYCNDGGTVLSCHFHLLRPLPRERLTRPF